MSTPIQIRATARVFRQPLKLELPPGRKIQTRHKRLADELNAQWIDRYRAEQAERLSVSSESERDKFV